MHTLNILSLNVNGLNSAVKRTRVLEYLHCKSISCALIQKTHLKQSDVARFQNEYYGLIAFSCAQNGTGGVLVLVDRRLDLAIGHVGGDGKGGFVFVRCRMCSGRLALVSVCGPSGTDGAFLAQISGALLGGIGCPLVVGGDFDAVMDPALDGSRSGAAASPSSKLLGEFISGLGLVDLWRIRSAEAGDFAFFSGGHGTFSGVDCIFLGPSLVSSGSSMSILPVLLSDHSAVLCGVPLSGVEAGSPGWRFNVSLLGGRTFIASLGECIGEFLGIGVPSGVDPQVLWETTGCAVRGFCVSFSSALAGAGTHQFAQLENRVQSLQGLRRRHFAGRQATQLSSLKEEYDLLSH